ncbi:sensor histidine kinase [Siphonobacter aquaeclarae]|uniref:histidine kinase n=1 Tax=Siphonobacter aquaeclarae TaxID=563176 RepID=A0A1G9L5H2_9BACT|nr:ATP-binding protein [Siphonobacter aquaeclarae]SDL56977.1 His Kinase A (phospho-acceptor) domain-containing protein [Siphonobacter aquaeclarae]
MHTPPTFPVAPDEAAMPPVLGLTGRTFLRSPQPCALLWGTEGWFIPNAAFARLFALSPGETYRREVTLPLSWNLVLDSSSSGNATVATEEGLCSITVTVVFGEDDREEGRLLQLGPPVQRDEQERELNRLTRELDELLATRNREWAELNDTCQRMRHYQEQFAALASHDLHEPLRKIKSFSEVLRKQYIPASDMYAQNVVSRLRGAVQRMQQLLDDLSTFSELAFRPESLRRLALTDFVREIVQSDTFREYDIAVEPLPEIDADPAQMSQLFGQLLRNAVKFTRPGEAPRVRISGKVWEEKRQVPEQPARWVALQVEDEGIGFGEEDRERIFQLFQRLHGREQYPGSGIGLAVCRRIADLHGGSIEARGIPEKGSVFTVYLPSVS